ncbi:Type I phosphodiesterase / nucleotide pyrophosphatase [Roseimaritima multifibrata]|uniref:Type I phosphodiesterase / nucleotide pyrophosphatase n=1 Tax=Roseimaritima multifibrata TaxID=1930274 RepID=A0A517MLJ8_9BACT|nr:alkaline phosphatase family protein [Roseimaritima multifibrata]QDS95730.1 Type I phosphodiesterase / nucleotide pyrophosphatase [Roseimaritima multifibrata]
MMTWTHRTFAVLIAAWFCSSPVTRADEADTQRHVVIVSLDGLAAYLVDDPKVPLPTIRRLAREGCIVDGGMTVSNPSVTWPNHTTLLTGVRPEKHGVLANGVLVRGPIGMPTVIDSKRDQADLVRLPTIVDVAHQAGMRTGEINWPCTRGSESFDDQFPDVPDALEHSTPRLLKELVELELLDEDIAGSFKQLSTVGRDHLWTQAACHLIRSRKPNLMLVHLLNVDSVHHTLGPQTAAGYTANAYADMCLAQIVDAIDDAGIREQTTLIVVSDHGFAATPKAIRPNVVLREAGMLAVDAGKLSTARVHVVPEGGIGLVYCTNPSESKQTIEAFKKLFLGKEGVADVISPDRYREVGFQHPREYSQSPDAILVAADGHSVSGSVTGDTLVASNTEARTAIGSHGFLSTMPKMKAMCILSGAGIPPGTHLSTIENIDIAPTVAQILGLDYPSADGKALTVLQKP